MISTGFTISDILNFNTFTFKPNGGLELGVDFSPSSDATYRYLVLKLQNIQNQLIKILKI